MPSDWVVGLIIRAASIRCSYCYNPFFNQHISPVHAGKY
jgi:hypothetical protein